MALSSLQSQNSQSEIRNLKCSFWTYTKMGLGKEVSDRPPSIMPHPEPPHYKFQKLDVYQLGLEFVDQVYRLTSQLPESERFNLRSQLERAATSIVLNIAEGSTCQTDLEQNRFLGMALRSYLETVACMDLIERRKYLNIGTLDSARHLGHQLFVKLQALRRALKK